jgi:Fe-S cluster assembly scaffold protein SufB
MAKVTFGNGITLSQQAHQQFDVTALQITSTDTKPLTQEQLKQVQENQSINITQTQTLALSGSGTISIAITQPCTLTIYAKQATNHTVKIAVHPHIVCTLIFINTVSAYEQLRYIHCLQDSQTTCISVDAPTQYGKSFTHVTLDAYSKCNQKAITLATQQAQHELTTISEHAGIKSQSDIQTKTLVSHTAQSLCKGLVKIQPTAQGSQGYEHQKALMLSKTAKAFAIPNLEIENHDVACTHGSSIGRVDPTQIFYLQSKGLTKELATLLIAQAFLGEFQQYMTDELTLELQERLVN